VQPRIDYYRALWAVRHELTRALYQRVPQLAPASPIAEVEASEINLFA